MKSKLSYKLAVLLAAVGLLAVPAAAIAQDSTSCSGSQDSCTEQQDVNDSSESDSSGSDDSSGDFQAEREVIHQEAMQDAKEHIAALKLTMKMHSQQQRKRNCQAAKHGLETKLSRLQKNAERFKNKIDSALQKAIDYKTSHNLNPANYDTLLSDAQAAKSQAEASVSALDTLNVNLDCNSGTVAQNVATFRAAAAKARSDLLAYKQDVKAILKNLEEVTGEL